tara:strand:- start:471 stop:1193 length:723 start_codon:yes stop_codon:yes gene_type:complete
MNFRSNQKKNIIGLVTLQDLWIQWKMPFNPKYYKSFSFSKTKDFSLVMIGAHNGKKTKYFVRNASKYGKVCLIEPVPYLFQQLEKLHRPSKNMTLLNKCISPVDVEFAEFYALSPKANKIQPYGDQLGSLSAEHAKNHDIRFESAIHKIKVETFTLAQLLEQISCSDINLLFLDTEGFDTEILPTFPFEKLKPKAILFEHKHSDGTHNIGEKFANIIVQLNKHGYRVQCIDRENCLATLK